MNANLKIAAAFVCLTTAATGALAAGPTLWVSDASGRLETIDVGTGATTFVANMGRAMFDIAFSPTGQLYGVSGSALYAIDSTSGATTFVGGSSGGNINSLVFSADGTLYGASTRLYKFDVASGSSTAVGPNFSGNASSSGDLAFINGNLFLSTLSSPDHLQRIDTSTGLNTDIGSIGFNSVFGLASPNGKDLYGFSGTQVLSIDAATGAGTAVATANGAALGQVFGSAFRTEAIPAVPEPQTYALMLTALAAFAAVAKRGRR